MCAYQRMLAAIFLSLGALSSSCSSFNNDVSPNEVIPRISQTLPWWVEIVENNPDCGLKALKVAQSVELTGRVGHRGTALWQQPGCRVHLTEPLHFNPGCEDEVALTGHFYIAYEKQMTGWLTSDGHQPVMTDADSQIRYQIQISDLNVNISNASEDYVFNEGSLSFYSEFGVVENDASGLCEHRANVPHKVDVQIENVAMELLSDANGFKVSHFNANYEVAQTAPATTLLKGYLSTPASSLMFSLPSTTRSWTPPGAQCESSEASMEMTEGTSCLTRPAKWSQEAVRMSFSLVDAIIELMERHPQCGFQTPGVTEHSTWDGTVGSSGGRVIYEVASPCLIELRENTPVMENCHGEKTLASGVVWVTGQKTVEGWLTGDSHRSVVQDDALGTTYDLSLTFEDFQWQQPGASKLGIRSGLLQTKVRPKYALNLENGKCDVRTPEMDMQELQWTDGQFVANETLGAFDFNVVSATAEGVRGSIAGKTNTLKGELNVSGADFLLPLRQKESYVDWNSLKFKDSYRCRAKVDYTPDALACDYLNELSTSAASLLLEAFAQSNLEMASEGSECGYENPQIALNPAVQSAEDELEHRYTWGVEKCEMTSEAFRIQEDCDGFALFSKGPFTYSGTKHESGLALSPTGWLGVSPQRFDALTFDVSELSLDGYELFYADAAQDDFIKAQGIRLNSGRLSGRYLPVRGLNLEVAGQYDVPTPIAAFEDIQGMQIDLEMWLYGQKFDLQIEEIFVNGQKGAFAGTANEIYGRMKVNGRWIQVNTAFDPDYDQAEFDASYACHEALTEVIPKD